MVVVNQKHISLNRKLIKESNALAKNFSSKSYSKIENIDTLLLKRDISVGNKKRFLVKKLHSSIVKTFSIDKRKFDKKAFNSLGARIQNIRKIVIKLRSLNYYLETLFLDELKFLKITIQNQNEKLATQSNLAEDELEALEYTAYKFIEEAVILDKNLLQKYSHKQSRIVAKQKIEIKDLSSLLRKESEILEHLEAKLPPSKMVTTNLTKEPIFTHWVARIFALLSYFEHLYQSEAVVISKLRKNKLAKARIGKKILHLARERSKLLDIMEEKAISMRKFKMDNELRKELRNLTTVITL